MSEPIEQEQSSLTAEELQRLPPELRPDKDGRPPKITEKLLKQMRGHYFTVKHVLLENCGHKLDMINQPKNNCPDCWWTWFRTHPQLMETADQFYRTHGRGPMVGMRGLKFVKMFERTMATLYHQQQEEAALKAQEKANRELSDKEQFRESGHCALNDSNAGVGTAVEG